MFNYLEIESPKYDSCEKVFVIKDVYAQTEPYDDLFSIKSNSLFKKKEDAYRELILWLYFEYDYDPFFNIQDIYTHQITNNDIFHLEKYLEHHLKEYGFSWKIAKIKVLFNKEEL